MNNFCYNCKFYKWANGYYWCNKNQSTAMINNYPCSFYESALDYTITTTTELVTEEVKDKLGPAIEDRANLISLSSRLAESILMDWSKEQQIELAKDVACLTHKLLFENIESK